MTTKSLNRRQARWAKALARFNFIMKYRKGKDNPVDGLSRRPNYIDIDKGDFENSLGDLLCLQLRAADKSQANHLQGDVSALIIAVTRLKTRQSREPLTSALNTLV
jgi:hypothetical protein